MVSSTLRSADDPSIAGGAGSPVHIAPGLVVRLGAPSFADATDHLLTIIQRLAAAASLETVMRIVRGGARLLTGADGAAFVLKEGELCHYADEEAIGPLWKGQRFPLSACISGWTMLNREPAAVEDIALDPRVPLDAYRATFVKSLVMVPIRRADPIGAIGVYWSDRHRASAQEIRLLQALADGAALAMQSVHLARRLDRCLEELATLQGGDPAPAA